MHICNRHSCISMSSLLLLKPDYFLNLEFSELLPSRPPPHLLCMCFDFCHCHATDVFDPVLYTNATLIIVETRLILEL